MPTLAPSPSRPINRPPPAEPATDNIRIVQRVHSNPATDMVEKIDLEIQVPSTFPEKYRDSLIRSAELCKVKKHLEKPPMFNIATQVAAPALSAN